MFHTVKKVKYLEGYKLALVFDDGKIKIVDFEGRLKNAKNMFVPLKDLNYFQKVRVDGITIVWPNGLDLCPDVLYEIGEDMLGAKQSQTKQKAKVPIRKNRISTKRSKSQRI